MIKEALPEGWKAVKLGEIARKITKGATPTTYGFPYQTSGINFIKIENVKNGKLYTQSIKNFISPEAHTYQKKSQLEINDILFSIAGTIGETCIIRKEYLPANTNQAFAIINGIEDTVLPSLLNLQLERFVNQIRSKSRGGAMNNVSLEDLKEFNVILPPYEKQHLIVEKIEELFSELDKSIENLKTAQQQLKAYRQAVLKWAFEGKLTNEEVKDGELPVGWEWVKLGDVSESCLGKMLDKGKNKGSLMPYLRNKNVRWNSFDTEDLFEMRFEPFEYERFGIKAGDLIICEGGEPGRAAIWKQSQIDIKIQKALHRVRFSKDVIPDFFLYYLNWISSIKLIDQYFTGTTIKHLTGQSLKKIELPLPKVYEQQQIVQEIESRLSVCDKMEETITTSLQQAEALRQSILKKAFEGKLTHNT